MHWKKHVEAKTLPEKKKNQTTCFKYNDIFPHSKAIITAARQLFSPQILLVFNSIPVRRSIKRIFTILLLVNLLIVYAEELPYLINKLPISLQIKKNSKGKVCKQLCTEVRTGEGRGGTFSQ